MIKKYLNKNTNFHPGNTIFLTGIAKGPDTILGNYFETLGYTIIRFKTPYTYFKTLYQEIPKKWKNRLYFAKDMNTVDNCQEIWTFWDGKSSGTKMTFEYGLQQGKTVVHFLKKPGQTNIELKLL